MIRGDLPPPRPLRGAFAIALVVCSTAIFFYVLPSGKKGSPINATTVIFSILGALLLLILIAIAFGHYRAAKRRAALRRTHPGFIGAPPLWAYSFREPTPELPQFSITEHPRFVCFFCYVVSCYSCAAADLAAAVPGAASWAERCCTQGLLPHNCIGDDAILQDYAEFARMHGIATTEVELRTYSLPCTARHWPLRRLCLTAALMQLDAGGGARGGEAAGIGAMLLSGAEKGDEV
jgi:hypothetical protein